MLIDPLIAAPSADPWMIYHDHVYYYCESRRNTTIHVRQAKHFLEIGNDEGVRVWHPPRRGLNSRNIWAPELHFVDGKWLIYYAADDGNNANHRMWVLEADTPSPQGTYHCAGCLDTGGWAIDGTIFRHNGALFFVWSGWPGKVDGQQNLYIAPMNSATQISGPRVLISEPTNDWERYEMPINEGPQVLQSNGRTFIVYSASASWTMHYCLGMLELVSDDVLNPSSWRKTGPVFQKNEFLWGVGHCSFVKSTCQTEDWILYHAKMTKKRGWLDRRVHAQRFHWRADGRPEFGTPMPFQRSTRLAA